MIRFSKKPSNSGGCFTMLIGAGVTFFFYLQGKSEGKMEMDGNIQGRISTRVIEESSSIFELMMSMMFFLTILFVIGALLELFGIEVKFGRDG